MARREWNVAGNGQFGRLAQSARVRRKHKQDTGTCANRHKKKPRLIGNVQKFGQKFDIKFGQSTHFD